MKWFWYNLIVFCLLMCSCKSKNLSKSVGLDSHVSSETAYMNTNEKIDTTKTAYTEQTKDFKLLYETITETIYDTDKKVAEKVTETKRTFVQDTKTDIAEEIQNRVETHSQDSLNQFRKVTKKMESETEEETKGGQEAFGKWLGIVLGLAFVALIIYLRIKKKLRVS